MLGPLFLPRNKIHASSLVAKISKLRTLTHLRISMASISSIGNLRKPLLASIGKASNQKGRTASKPQLDAQRCHPFHCISNGENGFGVDIDRRKFVLSSSIGLIAGALWIDSKDGVAMAAEFADMPALRGKDYGKTKMRYPDYIETESGLQYKDLRMGSGPTPKTGETVVVDWDGYTIGYYGRIFEARNKTKGGSFEGGDKDFFKFRLGLQEVIPAFEEAVSGMAQGGIRRIVVPPEIGYPDNDYNRSGPKPTTFSGQRALDFVLKNQGLIDKTLLFDIELVKVAGRPSWRDPYKRYHWIRDI